MNSRPGAATAMKPAARSRQDARDSSAGSRRPGVLSRVKVGNKRGSATRGSRADEGVCPTFVFADHQALAGGSACPTLMAARMARAAAAANPDTQNRTKLASED